MLSFFNPKISNPIPNVVCFAHAHLYRPPAITYGNGLATSFSPK